MGVASIGKPFLSSFPERKFVFIDPIRKIPGRAANQFSLGNLPSSGTDLCGQGERGCRVGLGSTPSEHVSSAEVEQLPRRSGGHSQVRANDLSSEN